MSQYGGGNSNASINKCINWQYSFVWKTYVMELLCIYAALKCSIYITVCVIVDSIVVAKTYSSITGQLDLDQF